MSAPTSPPNNTTNPVSIIPQLKALIESREDEITAWFETISKQSPFFFYNSVDLRHSGFKLAPVDTNLFPAGFNNLNEAERINAVSAIRTYLQHQHPNVENILILAEDHTRNSFYIENIYVLKTLIEQAGYGLRISSLRVSEARGEAILTSHSEQKITFKPFEKVGDTLQGRDGFIPDLILVNNDMTDGAPDMLTDIRQVITPPLGFGWYQRRKTSHFEAYNHIARKFCENFDLDPWLISTIFERCGVVNFKERKGIDCVAGKVEKTLFRIQKKYDEYGITETPYVFIKSDRGTYGMGIMTAQSPDDVYEMSKNIRKKMNTIKGGEPNTEVIIQEGIPTIDRVDEHPAEPMIYLIGGQPVGCIYRLNTKKGTHENLNASGMQFTSISAHNDDPKICCSLGLVTRLAACASAWECYSESYDI